MAGNNGGPWGGGGGRGPTGGDDDDGDKDRRNGGRRPGGEGPQIPEIDELMNKGREQLRVLMGGGNRGGSEGGSDGGGGNGFEINRGTIGLGVLAVVAFWLFQSFYSVQPNERSVELFLGQESDIGDPGLNFAPWPLVTHEIVQTTSERTESIGSTGDRSTPDGLMLTTDENVVDIGFQVVWNVSEPANFLFNIAEPEETVQAVSESVMREIIAARNLAPILNRDRDVIRRDAEERIQATLNSYEAGIQIIRVNLRRAEPPNEVLAAFLSVQAAEQERDQLQREADRDANQALADARGQATQVVEDAEAYRAEVTNEALGRASRFLAILEEYREAEDVTRQRLFLDALSAVYADTPKIILDSSVTGAGGGEGSGVIPFLPLNELMRDTGGRAAASTEGN